MEESRKLLENLQKIVRTWRNNRKINSLRVYSQPDDLSSLALKIALQRSKGTKIGQRCRFLGRVDSLNPHLVEIGDRCVIGTESMLLAHGPGFDGKSRTVVGDYSYLGFRVTVLPGVRIGSQCIIGAGSIVTRDIPDGSVAAGNPARVLRSLRPDEVADLRHRMDNDLYFGRNGQLA